MLKHTKYALILLINAVLKSCTLKKCADTSRNVLVPKSRTMKPYKVLKRHTKERRN